ncbi:MAG: DUF2945 domain-containing protein [Sphingobacteriales bacterium]|jgi:hypothetical protein|nr:DUF2945 domain-containing protein [Sphingobacteriales bacterium]
MKQKFKIGDIVSWNSESGRVSGEIIKIYTGDFIFKGYTHPARPEYPQYGIKSLKTNHIAAHKGSALTKTDGYDSGYRKTIILSSYLSGYLQFVLHSAC